MKQVSVSSLVIEFYNSLALPMPLLSACSTAPTDSCSVMWQSAWTSQWDLLVPFGRSIKVSCFMIPVSMSIGDTFQGKFTWKIEHFTKLKELLKKRKITGLCIKSRRFQVGSRDCRLIVYPRGKDFPLFSLMPYQNNCSSEWTGDIKYRPCTHQIFGTPSLIIAESAVGGFVFSRTYLGSTNQQYMQ